jgi:hypothetical protein
MTTRDENVKQVMRTIEEKTPDPNYDLVVTTPATGNKEYIEWIKSNTITREAAERLKQQDAEIPDSLVELGGEVESPSY